MADTETCVALSQLMAAMSAVQRSPNSWWPWYQEILRQALASLDPYVHYYKSEQPDRLGVLLQYISAITQAIIQQGPSADHIGVTSMAIRAMGESRQAIRCIHDNASITI